MPCARCAGLPAPARRRPRPDGRCAPAGARRAAALGAVAVRTVWLVSIAVMWCIAVMCIASMCCIDSIHCRIRRTVRARHTRRARRRPRPDSRCAPSGARRAAALRRAVPRSFAPLAPLPPRGGKVLSPSSLRCAATCQPPFPRKERARAACAALALALFGVLVRASPPPNESEKARASRTTDAGAVVG